MSNFQRGGSTINRKSGLKWGVLEKISTLKIRLYLLANENSQKPTIRQEVWRKQCGTESAWRLQQIDIEKPKYTYVYLHSMTYGKRFYLNISFTR